MEVWGKTDKGKVRPQNQDFFEQYKTADDFCVLLVCDGMGGAKAGNVASELASAVFRSEAEKLIASDTPAGELGDILRRIVASANAAVYQLSRANDMLSGMGTTLVGAVIIGEDAVICNVGDSRAYLISGDELRQITKDHSVVENMVDRGDITREESRTHPNKNYITRAVGTVDRVECDLFSERVREGEVLLLCSDGLTNTVEDWEIHHEAKNASSAQELCEKLVALSLERGAPDNVTVVVCIR